MARLEVQDLLQNGRFLPLVGLLAAGGHEVARGYSPLRLGRGGSGFDSPPSRVCPARLVRLWPVLAQLLSTLKMGVLKITKMLTGEFFLGAAGEIFFPKKNPSSRESN